MLTQLDMAYLEKGSILYRHTGFNEKGCPTSVERFEVVKVYKTGLAVTSLDSLNGWEQRLPFSSLPLYFWSDTCPILEETK